MMYDRVIRGLFAGICIKGGDGCQRRLPARHTATGTTFWEAAVSSRTNQVADDCHTFSKQLTGGAAGRTTSLSMTTPTKSGDVC